MRPRSSSARERWKLWCALLCAALALLNVGSIDLGLLFDDVPIGNRLQEWLGGTSELAWWDVYKLSEFDPRKRFGGVLPWWTADELHVRFFRPLAAATHLLDQVLWPSRPELMHVHNIAWAACLNVCVLWLYSEVFDDRRVVILAAVVFACSYTHIWPVSWIANRNVLTSAVFGVLTILLYRRWRLGAGRGGPAALLTLVASLLSAEAGVSTLAFVVGFELFEGRRHPHGRVAKLGAVAFVVAAWKVGYQLGDFGALGSGAYVDPFLSPEAFVTLAPERLGWLFVFLVTPGKLVLWPHLSSSTQLGLGVVFSIGGVGVLFYGFRWSQTRGWLVAALLSLVPLVASLPQARLLTFALIGFAPAIAVTISTGIQRGLLGKAIASLAIVTHLLVSPVLLAGGLEHFVTIPFRNPGLDIGADQEIKGRNLVLLHVPSYDIIISLGSARSSAGRVSPAFTWTLSVASDPPKVSRKGCCTLVLHNPTGIINDPWAFYYRGPHVPFVQGERIKTLAFEATVDEVNAEGAATTITFEFIGPLESKSLLFVRWNGEDLERVQPRALP